MSRLQSLHETTKGRFERARCAPPEALNDEPQAKRRARSDSASGNMKHGAVSSESGDDSGSDEIAGSMSLGSDSSQSDDSGDDESNSDGSDGEENTYC